MAEESKAFKLTTVSHGLRLHLGTEVASARPHYSVWLSDVQHLLYGNAAPTPGVQTEIPLRVQVEIIAETLRILAQEDIPVEFVVGDEKVYPAMLYLWGGYWEDFDSEQAGVKAIQREHPQTKSIDTQTPLWKAVKEYLRHE